MRKGLAVSSKILAMLAAAAVIGIAGAADAQSTWNVTLTASEDGTANTTTLTFGVDPAATAGVDGGIALEVVQPPLPPAGNWDARFTDTQLIYDIRVGANGTAQTFPIGFQRAAGANNVTFTWNQAQVAQATAGTGGTAARIQDQFGGILGVDVDMSATNTLQITNGAISAVNLTFTSTDNFQFPDLDALTFNPDPPAGGAVNSGAAFNVVVNATLAGAAAANVSVTLVANGANNLTGGLTATTDAAGDATFSLTNQAGVDGESVTFDASALRLDGVTTVNAAQSGAVAFDVVATTLATTTAPAGSVSGAALTTQPVYTAQDGNGVTDTDYTSLVTVAVTTGAGAISSNTATAVAGVATLAGMTYTATADQEAFTLTASGGGISSAASGSITSDVVATDLEIVTQPASPVNGLAFGTQPVVRGVDGAGTLDTGFTGNVGAAINVVSGTPTLTGTQPVAAVAGIATFTDLGMDVANDGEQGTVTFSSAGLNNIVSAVLTGTTLPPPVLTVIADAVAGVSENKSPTLTWAAVPAATGGYLLDFGTVSGSCEDIQNDLAIAVGTTTYATGLLADRVADPYCWRVASVSGGLSVFSADDTFTVVPTFGEWGLIFLIASMAAVGLFYVRRVRA